MATTVQVASIAFIIFSQSHKAIVKGHVSRPPNKSMLNAPYTLAMQTMSTLCQPPTLNSM